MQRLSDCQKGLITRVEQETSSEITPEFEKSFWVSSASLELDNGFADASNR